MKKLLFFLIVMGLSIVSLAQSEMFESVKGDVPVLDSSVIEDAKLLVTANIIYSEEGLISTILKQAGKEKEEKGKIEKQEEFQAFIDEINYSYQKLIKNFIKVDTVWLDEKKVTEKISEIENWRQSVMNDPDKKSKTTITVWSDKDSELKVLQKFDKQIKERKK